MARAAFASTAAAIAAALAWVLPVNAALASDREFRAVLDRMECVPERVVPNRLSPNLVVFEVICKRSGRVLHVECLAADCRLLARPRDDNDR